MCIGDMCITYYIDWLLTHRFILQTQAHMQMVNQGLYYVHAVLTALAVEAEMDNATSATHNFITQIPRFQSLQFLRLPMNIARVAQIT